MEKFVHLNVKSEYSLLNGITKTSDIINTVKNFDIPAVALTDLNNMHNAYHFGEKCKKAGVKHIIGVTFCVQYSEKEYGNITLLAKNTTGYKNLVCLSTLANKGEEHTGKNGFPYITLHQLAKYPSGLICLTGGSSGIFFKQFNRSYLETLLKIYGQGNVYFEFQNHKTPEEKKFLRNPAVYQTLQELNIEPVATNDVYYLKEEHAFHRSLALQMNPNPNGIEFTSSFINRCNHFYLKTPEEMVELFQPYLSLYPNILSNTVKIAEECKATVPVEKALPEFPIPDGYTNETYLRFLCEEGFHERFDGRLTPEETKKYRERLDYEFGVIKTMGFIDYHLITADFIQWAKDDKVYEHPRRYFPENTFPDLSVVPEKLWKKDYEILVGPGRGSAAGSLLCYCLKITNLDPIADGLLFERFLNVERVSMPK